MRFRKIGSTGLQVSAICLGCMSFGDSNISGAGGAYEPHRIAGHV